MFFIWLTSLIRNVSVVSLRVTAILIAGKPTVPACQSCFTRRQGNQTEELGVSQSTQWWPEFCREDRGWQWSWSWSSLLLLLLLLLLTYRPAETSITLPWLSLFINILVVSSPSRHDTHWGGGAAVLSFKFPLTWLSTLQFTLLTDQISFRKFPLSFWHSKCRNGRLEILLFIYSSSPLIIKISDSS